MTGSGFVPRLIALVRKETRQMLRDRSNLAVGLLLPATLILLFGYGMSFDVVNAPLAVVMEDNSPTARAAVAGLQGTPYLAPVWLNNMAEAENRMRNGKVDGILRVPVDFSARQAQGQARVQLLLNGVDTSRASAIEGYVKGALDTVSLQRLDRAGGKPEAQGSVAVVQRMWFNEANESTWYLVPGLIAVVMTLIGAFLTSLLISREWERGTLESLFVTPVRPLELLLAKLAPYLVLGTADLVLCLMAAKFLFHVPLRGSLGILVVASMLYLMVSLLFGLLISGATRDQFHSSQMSLVTSFMPAVMLSGFVFDLRNMPLAIQVVSQVIPATHFMGLVKTLFLAGNDWAMIFQKCGILTGYAVLLTLATRRTLRKQLN